MPSAVAQAAGTRSRSFGRLQYLLQESLQRVTGGTRGTETLKQVGAGEGGDVDDSGHSFGHLGLEDGEQDGASMASPGRVKRKASFARPAEGDERYSEASHWTHITFMTLEHHDYSDLAHVVGWVMMVLIVLSVSAFIVGTMPRFRRVEVAGCGNPVCIPGPGAPCHKVICLPQPLPVLEHLETATIVLFTIEYLLRLGTVGFLPLRLIYPGSYLLGETPRVEPSVGEKVLGYMCQPLNLVDAAAIFPYYFQMLIQGFHVDMSFLRLVRLARIFRILKMARYSESSHLVTFTLRKSVPALLLLCLFLLIMTTVFGSLVYYFESGTFRVTTESPEGAFYRPTARGDGEEVSPFTSILISSYWVVMTATTVGYGDFYCTTPGGRLVSVICSMCGIVCIAMPMTIIGKHFNDAYFESAELRRAEEQLLSTDRQALTHTPPPHHNDKDKQHRDAEDWGAQDGGDEEEGAGMEHKEGHSEGQRRQLVYLLRQQAQSMERSSRYVLRRLEELERSIAQGPTIANGHQHRGTHEKEG